MSQIVDAAVGSDVPHDSAVGHVTGESVFIDDVPPMRGEVLVDFLGSPVAHGRVKSIDLTAAETIPGVLALLTAKDVPGHNIFGPILKDEHLLVDDLATFVGDPVVLIAAENRGAIQAAKKAIKLEVEELSPIFSIEDAIAAGSFIGPERVIARGDVDQALRDADHVLSGELHIGGQEHFYLESQAALAYPGEYGQMVIHSSTQHPTETQNLVAEILGVSFNQVVVICKRMGGAFGGKESQAAGPAAMAAMVAARSKRPARVVYGKDDDMRVTGKRHPFLHRYTVGFDSAGKITALKTELFSNGGCSCDLSPSVLERSMLHSDNAYWLPNVRITARVCKTNLPSNTAFRGFGGPQGVAGTENVIEEIARHLDLDGYDVRRANLYGVETNNVTPYGQRFDNNVLAPLLDQLRDDSSYNQRRKKVQAFNRTSRTHVRGLAMTPVKFGISFTKKTLNQGNALVNLYTDGTVIVTTGATEMGQGVNIRVAQIVADELGIEVSKVIVGATATDKNCNTSPTAASTGTDINGAAAAVACEAIRGRLAEFAATLLADLPAGLALSPGHLKFAGGWVYDTRDETRRIKFHRLVCQAYAERVDLGARGFYATPGVDFNRETGKGHPFLYYTNGAAVAEVLIDRFTGEMKVDRVDLLMDAGRPINPGIDRGQITGGFIQGMGWVTTEELKYSPRGDLLSHSPTTYKIPNVTDVPETFNVNFFDNGNSAGLKRHKSLGEPPLLLGLCVWMAVKDALGAAWGEAAIPPLAMPATGEAILMALPMTKRRRREAADAGLIAEAVQ